jgi:hypothetical protein
MLAEEVGAVAKRKKETFTKEELESITDIYDHFGETIKEASRRRQLVVNPIKAEIQKLADRNANVLQTNILGKQLLFGEEIKNRILEAVGLNQEEMMTVFKEDEYFKQFGDFKLRDQLLFAVPMIMLSREFYLEDRIPESQFFYMAAFYKPYATVVFKYFGKYEVNEDQMRYTVENLSERYDIKREGTLFAVLVKMAQSSYNNYIAVPKSKKTFTDRELHVIFTSGIYSRLNNFMQAIYGEYDKNKGKYLPFEDSTFEGKDDSEGETFERDIQSDAAVRDSVVKRAVSSIIKKPVDEQLIELSAKFGFVPAGAKAGSYKYSGVYTDVLRSTVLEVVERKFREIPELFENIIGSFLFETNPQTNKKFSANDLRSAIFVSHSQRNFSKSPNTKNKSNLRVREIIEQFLVDCSERYVTWGNTQRAGLKKALHFYMILVIQKG